MDIVIISNFCENFSEYDNDRFLYLAKKLSKDNNVEIITSDFYHTKKQVRKQPEKDWPFTITFLHEGGYTSNVCLKRFYSHFIWGLNVESYLMKRRKPDVIYCAVPSLTAAYKTALYCEKNNIKFIIDVQDLWPEAFKMVFNVPLISDAIFYPFMYIANSIYKRADRICAVSETYLKRATKVSSRCKTGLSVYLGTDLKEFNTNSNTELMFKKKDGEIWLGYCGTLGSSYDLTYVMDALCILKMQKSKVPVFIVMGDGPRMNEFKGYANNKNLDCRFTGRLPYNQMCALLKKCDFAVNPITQGAAQSIINKVGDYAAAGLAVINTQECEEYKMLVKEYNMGFNCSNNDPKELAKKISFLVEHNELRYSMGKCARRCAEDKFDRSKSYGKLISAILGDEKCH